MATWSSSLNMTRCLLDPDVGLKDGDYSPAHVGHMIGDVFHYKGVPSARRVGDLVLVRMVPYGMRPGHYLPAPPSSMWCKWQSDVPTPDPSALEVFASPNRLVPHDQVLFVQNLHPFTPAEEVVTYEENLLVYLTESVAGKFGRKRFSHTRSLRTWVDVLVHNRALVGLPSLTESVLRERFAPGVAIRRMKYPDYRDLDWKEILP